MFEDRSIRRKRKYIFTAIFLFLVFAAFGVGYFLNTEPPEASDDHKDQSKVNLRIPDSLINPETAKKPYEQVDADSTVDTVLNMSNKYLITPNTQLKFKTYYNSCKHTAEKTVQAANDEINMSEQQLNEKYVGWEISSFTPPVVELSRSVDTYCPNHYIIGVDGGYIAIYVYDENGLKVMQEKTDISLATLTPEDQQALNGGIVVDTDAQKEQTLEGFSN